MASWHGDLGHTAVTSSARHVLGDLVRRRAATAFDLLLVAVLGAICLGVWAVLVIGVWLLIRVG